MDPSQNPNVFHATTIVSVRRDGRVAVAGDGQVTLGATVENVANEKYWESAQGGFLSQGDPRVAKLSASVDF